MDVRLFEQGGEAYAERGLNGLADTWHEDVVYEEDPLFPGSSTYRGREAVLARFREYEEQLGPSDVMIEEIVERPDGAVVVWRHSGTTPASGVPFEQRWAWVVQALDGKAIHIRAHLDPEEALRA
jgi:ketosteroid isomerase-like protein